MHKNARLTPSGRALLAGRVQSGWTVKAAALAGGASLRTAYRWLGRCRREPSEDFKDRSSAPRRCPRRISPQRLAEIERLRRQRMSGVAIARQLDMPRSTVGAILRRLGLGKLSALQPREPVIRTSGSGPASCCTWTSRASAGSTASATASPGIAPVRVQKATLNAEVVLIVTAVSAGAGAPVPARSQRCSCSCRPTRPTSIRSSRRSGLKPRPARLRSGHARPHARRRRIP